MTWGPAPSSRAVRRLVEIAHAHVAAAGCEQARPAELTEGLRTLVGAGASEAQLTDLTVRWVRQQPGVTTAWFQAAVATPELHDCSDPGTMWQVPTESGTLTGTSVWHQEGFLGTLVTWSAGARPEARRPGPSWLLRASVWLGSAIDLAEQQAHAASVDDADLVEELRYQLVTTVSHELRTPLTTIRAGLELLLEGDIGELSPVQRRLLERMSVNADRLQTLADDVVALSVQHSGETAASQRSPLAPAVDVDHVARQCADRLGAATRIVVETDGVHLDVDESTLARILYRLLDNALQATAQNGVVEVRAHVAAGKGVVTVIDHGPGIPADELQRVTHAFYRTSRSRSQEIPGAGLGLTLASMLTRSCGGALSLRSTEGQGTTAELTFPDRRPEAEQDPAPSA